MKKLSLRIHKSYFTCMMNNQSPIKWQRIIKFPIIPVSKLKLKMKMDSTKMIFIEVN